jgi:lipopolysaccharide/colanic/teichoic acid biosynthesis glycosyltransferase
MACGKDRPLSSEAYETTKRVFDLIIASCGLLILAPLMLLIAVAIKVDSPGSVLYRGQRVGRYGLPFEMYKFRTMRPDAERWGTTTAQDDPRITRMGTLLRRLKLDEFPQLWNVLRGDMSLVGPRPEVEEHTSAYDAEEQAILLVPPGITDYSSMHFLHLAALLGTRNAHETFVHKVRKQKNQLRLRYVRNRCFSQDLRILLRTIFLILRPGRSGAPPWRG